MFYEIILSYLSTLFVQLCFTNLLFIFLAGLPGTMVVPLIALSGLCNLMLPAAFSAHGTSRIPEAKWAGFAC